MSAINKARFRRLIELLRKLSDTPQASDRQARYARLALIVRFLWRRRKQASPLQAWSIAMRAHMVATVAVEGLAKYRSQNELVEQTKKELRRLFRGEYERQQCTAIGFVLSLDLSHEQRSHWQRQIDALWPRTWDLFCESLDTNVVDHDNYNVLNNELMQLLRGIAVEAGLSVEPNISEQGSSVLIGDESARGAGQPGGTAGEAGKGGQKPKHDVKFWQRVRNTYEEALATGIGSKGAWNEAAKVHGIKSGNAARVQCARYLGIKRNNAHN